jgi:hypothetical protein
MTPPAASRGYPSNATHLMTRCNAGILGYGSLA